MSGHNKWSKIKHKKAASDAEKSKLFAKHANLVAVESRKARGDVRSPALVAAIERAKKDSMPKENIDRAILKGSGAEGASLTEVLYETYGPGGVAILITAVTDNQNRTTPEIRHLLSTHGASLGTSGSASWAFTKTIDGFTPTNPMSLSESDTEALADLISAISEHDDVQNVYTTADTTDVSVP